MSQAARPLIGALFAGIFAAAPISAQEVHPSGLRPVEDHATRPQVVDLPSGLTGHGTGRYIIRFNEQPLALYSGGLSGLAATHAGTRGEERLDAAGEASLAYMSFLAERQSERVQAIEGELGRALRVDYRYQIAFNGIAAALTSKEARRVAGLPNVAAVTPERVRHITTDAGPAWIGAPGIWNGSATGGLPGTYGEGIVVGVIDTGIWPEHPSFADIGGDGYDHVNPRSRYYGVCDPLDASYDPTFPCNDKLIGAWNYADGPTDNHGHGSHTASTAAGNFVSSRPVVAPSITIYFDFSGVAPHAAVIAYDACGLTTGCPDAGLIAAIDQAVADGVDVINYSLGGEPFDPWSDPSNQALAAANAAGIFVATSAGNMGPGSWTIGSPADAPWLTAVGATTHDRQLRSVLAGLSGGDTTPPPDIYGRSVTDAYGPAPIVYAGDFGDQYCLSPFAAGTWTSGEIVVCDRGGDRLAKGDNVMAGGAGGLIVANTASYGEFVSADAHSIPAVNIGHTAASGLSSWLSSGSGHTGTIMATSEVIEQLEADMLAGFSSRGPNLSVPELIKPDVVAPGADIVAADELAADAAVLSGTSMSSPHVAGAAALLRSMHPAWSPAEIKSALMMTAHMALFDDDGVSPSNAFDHGSGRIDLNKAGRAGLIMDETAAGFAAANPSLGGDPSQLNLASMADDACFGSCTWTRYLTNTLPVSTMWAAGSWSSWPEAVGASVSPPVLSLAPGATGEIQVTANTALAPPGSPATGAIELTELGGAAPDAHLPFAVWSAHHTDLGLFAKSVDASSANPGDTLTYDLQFENWLDAETIAIVDPIPDNSSLVPGSPTGLIDGSPAPFIYEPDPDRLVASAEVAPVSVDVGVGSTPWSYVPLSTWYTPLGCPADCDDGGFFIINMDVYYGGRHYDDAILSVNGTMEIGTESAAVSGPVNTALPDAAAPNNLLAPFWTDLDMTSAGNWYIGGLTDGVTTWDVFEWENVPEFGDPSTQHTFQIWFEPGTDNIHYVYGGSSPDLPDSLTVAAENRSGTGGDTYYHNGAGTAPAVGVDLAVDAAVGSVGSFSFQVLVGDDPVPVINEAEATLGSLVLESIAVTKVDDDCAPPWTRHLTGHTVTGVVSHVACRELVIGYVTVATGGEARYCAGRRVSFGKGFRVELGGSFRAGTDSSLDCSF
jgi:uncharacterized repeat protein (TIGR01451 family)